MRVVPRQPQSDFFVLAFAVAKILLTFPFCYIVLWRYEHQPVASESSL
jgi:hypothetical protein